MEPMNNQINLFVDYRDTPVRFPLCMGVLKERFGYQSDQEIPCIFRNIPGAREKCISIEIDAFNGITIKFLKYKYRRDEIFLRMQRGRIVEGYFERNNIISTRGFFFPVQIYREFVELQEETINFPVNLSPLNAKIQALGLLCDGDNFLISRELVLGQVQEDLNLCFLSNIAMDYLMINQNFRFISFFNELLGRFVRTVFSNNEANLYFATLQLSGERKLAYIVYSNSLYLMKIFYESFMSGLSLEEALDAEAREIRDLPRIREASSYRDFPIDINFDNYDLIPSAGGFIAVLNLQNFLDQIDEEPRVENLIFDPIPRNNQTYESCDVFLFKSSWRFFANDEKIPEECIICLKKFSDNDLIKRFACQHHMFHMTCINQWIGEHSTCPLCKYDLSKGLAEDKDAILLRKKRSNH